jgi:hypothetical protein
MTKNPHYRNITLSTRVSAAQKAEFTKIATTHNISVSEWILSIIEMNKTSYGTFGDPTPREIKVTRELELEKKKTTKLKAQLDTSDQYSAIILERSNKAIHKCDDLNYALKEACVKIEEQTKQIKEKDALIQALTVKKNSHADLVTPSSVSLMVISAIILWKRG